TMDFTLLFLPEGKTWIASPLFTTPEAMVPQKPRKSRLGRLTYCTGKRKSLTFLSPAICTFSRICIKVSPLYQGIFSLKLTTLSPSSADMGTKRISVAFNDFDNLT